MQQTCRIFRALGVLALVFMLTGVASAYELRGYLICGQTEGKVWTAWGDGSHKKIIDSGSSPSLSPNCRYFAYSKNGNVVIRDRTKNGKVVSTFPGGDPALTNTAVYYAALDDTQVKIWWQPIRGGTPQRLTDYGDSIAEYSPDAGGTTVAFLTEWWDETYDEYGVEHTNLECYDESTGVFEVRTTSMWGFWEIDPGLIAPWGDDLEDPSVSWDGSTVAYVRVDTYHNDYYVEYNGATIWVGYQPVMLGNDALYYFDDELYASEIFDLLEVTRTPAPSFLNGMTDAVVRAVKGK